MILASHDGIIDLDPPGRRPYNAKACPVERHLGKMMHLAEIEVEATALHRAVDAHDFPIMRRSRVMTNPILRSSRPVFEGVKNNLRRAAPGRIERHTPWPVDRRKNRELGKIARSFVRTRRGFAKYDKEALCRLKLE